MSGATPPFSLHFEAVHKEKFTFTKYRVYTEFYGALRERVIFPDEAVCYTIDRIASGISSGSSGALILGRRAQYAIAEQY